MATYNVPARVPERPTVNVTNPAPRPARPTDGRKPSRFVIKLSGSIPY